MPSLKDLKNRIGSVKNTQKITKAMKMVAAAKLRRAKEQAEAARPYAEAMEGMVSSLSQGTVLTDTTPKLLAGTGVSDTHLVIVATADRGLCGGFNSSIVKAARIKIRALQAEGKEVKLLFVGKKGYEQLRSVYKGLTIARFDDIAKPKLNYAAAEKITQDVIYRFEQGEFDVAHILYNKFKSAISQEITLQQIIPLESAQGSTDSEQENTANAVYEYEPDEATILESLLPKNLAIQIYRALLENAASEQGARMTAMDNATRNAGDMIGKLTLQYNRSRQAAITKELIEIISGAEAV